MIADIEALYDYFFTLISKGEVQKEVFNEKCQKIHDKIVEVL